MAQVNLQTFQLRLKSLEAKVVHECYILTESQLIALEKAQEETVAHGKIETHNPCYWGAQNTYYVGNVY